MTRAARIRSADFQVCCVAGFQTRCWCNILCAADLEVGDTAGLETCATKPSILRSLATEDGFVVKSPAMLRKIQPKKNQPHGGSFAIVASRYNARYVDAMLRAAKAELWRADVSSIQIVRVPGAYEIPVAAKHLARTAHPSSPDPSAYLAHPGGASPQRRRLSAIICLGVILRGETVHAAHIGEAVSRALMQIQLEHEIPVIHEVLLLENEAQACARCLNPKHNRGTEAAQTALAMARVLKSLQS